MLQPQVLLGGLSQWTVGLLATVMAVACIVAAGVGAYFFGKSWGRTKLTDISPKKTVEGAVGGLLCSTATAVAFSRWFRCVGAVSVSSTTTALLYLEWLLHVDANCSASCQPSHFAAGRSASCISISP